MKEIKYRATDIDTGDLVQGCLYIYNDKYWIPKWRFGGDSMYKINDEFFQVDSKSIEVQTDNGEWKPIDEIKIS